MKTQFIHTLLVCALLGATRLSALTVAEITDITPKVDETPTPIRTVAPDYPADLRKEGVAGVVSVVVVIDENGAVLASEVAKSSHEGFNQAATDAVAKWKFKPAKLAGKNVKVRVTIPVRFTTEEV
jgi:periplasmic protein TonB